MIISPKQSGVSAGLLFTALSATLPVHAAFDSGSTGADGTLNPSINTEIPLPPSGILNYTTVNIPAGVTVTFIKNTANTPVYLLASGNVTIAGRISLVGQDAKPTGTYGDGAYGDDGIPGAGGPGGYDGGRGGLDDPQQRVAIIRGGSGLGPGGGPGGIEGGDGCDGNRYYKYLGIGGGYASNAYSSNAVCPTELLCLTAFPTPHGRNSRDGYCLRRPSRPRSTHPSDIKAVTWIRSQMTLRPARDALQVPYGCR